MIYVYDPSPYVNDYVPQVYFQPLAKRFSNQIKTTDTLDLRNSTVVTIGQRLTSEIIDQLKNNGNKIVSFDINDASPPTYTYVDGAFGNVDLIFKVGGIQVSRYTNSLMISNDMEFSVGPVPFLSDANWEIYHRMRQEGRLLSLPYVAWFPWGFDASPGFDERKKLVLVRGGNHFQRYIMFLNMLKRGLVDTNSGFFAREYAHSFCEECRRILKGTGKYTWDLYWDRLHNCTSTVKWAFPSEMEPNFFESGRRGQWHNKCIPMFLWLSNHFDQKAGPIDKGIVETVLNAPFDSGSKYSKIITQYMFYADYKWKFSINLPPRFWEAVQAGTINFLPRRTNDQEYFPETRDGEHYLTFADDFSDISDVVNFFTKERYDHIRNSAMNTFNHWIKRGPTHTNDNLLDYIMERINAI